MPNTTTNITKTTCPYCGVGCGVDIHKDNDGNITVKPDKTHPANLGRLCSKGSALAETINHPDRLLYPEINNQRVDWETASTTVANKIQNVIAEHGADAVAFYVSGQLSTEDYYVANKLMKGYIGSANIDTNSRLCMASAVVAHKRAFGEDLVPCSYEDLEIAELIILVGSNTAWCHPVLYQRMVKAKKNNPNLRIVLIDPRKTQTADIADLHLPLKPGSDASLFNGLLNYLFEHQFIDQAFVDEHTQGMESALETAKATSANTSTVAQVCELELALVEQFFALFGSTEKAVSVFSQGINQSSSGVDKGNALINCHLLTGRIGKPGMGPFSFTGQPNAMGGREVGGLSNQLAAHMDIDNAEHRDKVQRFWQSPVMAQQQGLKAVDLFDAIHEGKVKLVWIMATNPAVSLPDSHKVRAALQKCETVIVSDCVRHTDTTAFADILLPAVTWGERNGTVTNSDRTISRQRPFLPTPGEAKGDWQILTDIAHKMGYANDFPYTDASDIFREHATLSAFENDGERCFDIGAFSEIDTDTYNQLQPQQWPVLANKTTDASRLFTNGHFFTATGKANFIAVTPQAPKSTISEQFPFRFNTGRVRDHWHTLTRTGVSPRLSAHISESYAEIHPADAQKCGIKDQQLIHIWNDLGELRVKAKLSEHQQRGSIFVPMHWNDTFSSSASISKLIPAVTDPYSGQPESKHAAVQIAPIKLAWHGFLLSHRKLSIPAISYWSCSRVGNIWQYELTCQNFTEGWDQFARKVLCADGDSINWVEYLDKGKQTYRAGRFHDKTLESCIFISDANTELPSRQWLISLFKNKVLSNEERKSLLSGKPATPIEDQGKTICSCFNVGEKTIIKAIKEQKLHTIEDIGKCLQAGTNCGSCIPELKEYL